MYNNGPIPYSMETIFAKDYRWQEMKSYFKSEYKNDYEYAYLNWLDEAKAKKSKKKVFSSVYLASLVAFFLPRNKD